jgi:hypothetical protein
LPLSAPHELTLSSGYDLWNAIVGGQTPCFSTLGMTGHLTPPPIPTSEILSVASFESTPASAFSITTVTDLVYAQHFSVTPQSPGLSTGAKAGIGTGSAVAGLAVGALSFLLLWQRRKHKKELESTQESSTNRASAVNSWVSNGGTGSHGAPSQPSINYAGSSGVTGTLVSDDSYGRYSSARQPEGHMQSPPLGQQYSSYSGSPPFAQPAPPNYGSHMPPELSQEQRLPQELRDSRRTAPQELHGMNNPVWEGRHELQSQRYM